MAETNFSQFYWIVIPAVALAGAVLLSLTHRSALRRSLLALWAVLPLIAFFALAFGQGCIPSAGVDQCYWVGFGFILIAIYGMPMWWIAIVVGLVAIWIWRKRTAP